MLHTIKKLLKGVFYQPTALEAFISSKNVQNTGDLEHWMQVYTRTEGWK